MPKKDSDYVPSSVKKQSDAADAAVKSAKAAKKPKKADPVKAESVVEPAIEDSGVTPTVEPAKADPVDTQSPAPVKDSAFEQKYNVLQGMYNKDTHELKTQLENVSAAMAKQEAIIANLSNVIETTASQPAATATPVQPEIVLDPQQFDGYGSEMVEAIGLVNQLLQRVSTLENTKPKSSAPNSDFTQRLDNIEATQQMTVKDTFYDELGKAIPDWGTQNHDPKFALWLEDTDPLSQVPRKVLLQHAFKVWNYKQVIALFLAYPGNTAAPVASAVVGEATGLAAQVVPETTGNAGENPGGQPKQTYSTKEDFLKAKDDFVKGRIVEADFDKISNSYQTGIRLTEK